MNSTFIPALIVFGILFAIAVFGLMRSSTAASRLHAFNPRPDRPMGGFESDSRFAEVDRR